jgi:hypothetical protein
VPLMGSASVRSSPLLEWPASECDRPTSRSQRSRSPPPSRHQRSTPAIYCRRRPWRVGRPRRLGRPQRGSWASVRPPDAIADEKAGSLRGAPSVPGFGRGRHRTWDSRARPSRRSSHTGGRPARPPRPPRLVPRARITFSVGILTPSPCRRRLLGAAAGCTARARGHGLPWKRGVGIERLIQCRRSR